MRISICAVGHRMPTWVVEGYRDYVQRMPAHIAIELEEIPVGGRRGRSEEQQLLRRSENADVRVALDENGQLWSTRELATRLEAWLQRAPRVAILIGGPDGLSDRCRSEAQAVWSLSRLTLPHALVRVVLVEQLYRAWTLLEGHPYHRA